MVPEHYALRLEPELGDARFGGHVAITVDVTEACSQIVVNAIELDVTTVVVDGTNVNFSLDVASERLFIDAPMTPGPAIIEITFRGVLNDQLRGFYRSTYRDADGAEHVIACSQMQATDCRRAFPCFDEPDFKATFGVTLVADDALLAISNGPEIARQQRSDGRWVVTFADTIPMSTYLVAFIVGRLEATAPVDVLGTALRIVHVPGKGHLTQFALDAGASALKWFEGYYGIPYPGTKIDMIALPDFAAGAMENLGCITYRESLLLIDTATSTQMERQAVADVVGHELAHMWFGDLVTMRWWNGIWLNEAFATFMGAMAVEVFRPSWRRWTAFSLERTDAFEVDSLETTRTVEFDVRAPAECSAMFDVLTYQKGGALLRMLQQYLGDERFRRGVNHYLHKHSYASTDTNDLWDSIEAVTTSDGGNEPVRTLMDSWIWQAGFPLVSARLEVDELILRQQRFSFNPDLSDSTLFITPVAVRVGDAEHMVLLDGAECRMPVGVTSDPIVVNAGGHGFIRVAYDDTLRNRLSPDVVASLSTVERYNLVDDASAACLAGRLSPEQLLMFLEGFQAEQELAVWQAIVASLRRLSRIVDSETWPTFQARVAALVSPALASLGWSGGTSDDGLQSKLRGLLISTTAVLGGDVAVQQRCRTLLEGDQSILEPELRAAAITVVASTGDVHDFERFVHNFRIASTPQEQLRNLYALAEFNSVELVTRACEFAFSDEVRSQNAPYLLSRCIANREHGAAAWTIVRKKWETACSRFPEPSIIRMIDSVNLLNTPHVVADVQAFFAEHPITQSAPSLAQVLERQRVNAAFRERGADAFATALRD